MVPAAKACDSELPCLACWALACLHWLVLTILVVLRLTTLRKVIRIVLWTKLMFLLVWNILNNLDKVDRETVTGETLPGERPVAYIKNSVDGFIHSEVVL